MPGINGLLTFMVQQEATELRLGCGIEPKLLRASTPLRLTMPATPRDTLRALLGTLWTDQRAALAQHGCVETRYNAGPLGYFAVTLELAGDDVDGDFSVVFRRAGDQVEAPSDKRSDPPPDERVDEQSDEPAAGDELADDPLGPPLEPAPPVATSAEPATRPPPSPELVALLARAVGLGASDLHLSDGTAPIVRVDGRLQVLEDALPVPVEALVESAADRRRLEATGALDVALEVRGVGRFRVNVFRYREGLAAALRLLQRTAPDLKALDLPRDLARLVHLPHGLVVVCGPTGCGKSSTLAALAQEALRFRPRVLITLEEPIELLIEPESRAALVRQREVGVHVPDFATGLRDALREDPDILLIGEMRDAETISLALTAAETGHLVLASLHSRTAASAVERIVDSYPRERQVQIRVQLADSLQAVISQRLLERADGHGRLPAVELMRVNRGVANLIREGKTAQIASALQGGREEGMMPLERSLANLVRSGRVARHVAETVANDPVALRTYLR